MVPVESWFMKAREHNNAAHYTAGDNIPMHERRQPLSTRLQLPQGTTQLGLKTSIWSLRYRYPSRVLVPVIAKLAYTSIM